MSDRSELPPKDGVKAASGAVCLFKLVDQVKCRELLDRAEKFIQTGDPNRSVDFSIFVTNSENHSLPFDGLGVACFHFQLSDDFTVEAGDCFTSDESGFHVVPFVIDPGLLPYAAKYIRKSVFTRPK